MQSGEIDMMTGPEIVSKFVHDNEVDWHDFCAWRDNADISQEELNHHDSRCLMHLERYVAWKGEYGTDQ